MAKKPAKLFQGQVSSMTYSKRLLEKEYSYTISHDIGSKWSMFLSLMLQHIFKRFQLTDLAFDVTDNTIFFTIPRQLLQTSVIEKLH